MKYIVWEEDGAWLGGTVLGSYISGQLMTRSGRYRIYPIAGLQR